MNPPKWIEFGTIRYVKQRYPNIILIATTYSYFAVARRRRMTTNTRDGAMSSLKHPPMNTGNSTATLPLRTVYLVRHGQSASNAGGVTMAHADIPLTELGQRQAQALAPLLPPQPARVWCSKFIRTQATAEPYCQRTGMAPVVHPLLHEFDAIDPALIAGMDGAQRRPVAQAFWAAADPHRRMGAVAETYAEFAERVYRFMATELPTLPDATVLFGHGTWIGMASWLLLGFDPVQDDGMRRFRRFQQELPMANGAVYCVQELAPGQWRVRADASVLRALADVQ
jgi:broad specificity phosphatase PhoE